MKKTTFIASTLASTAVVGSIFANTALANGTTAPENSWQQIHKIAMSQGFTWTENVAYYLNQKTSQSNKIPTIIKPAEKNTSQQSDSIVVSEWYYSISNLVFNLTDNSYAFLGKTKDTSKEFDLDNLKDLSHLFSSLVYNGKVLQKDKPFTDLSLKDGSIRYLEAVGSGTQLPYSDVKIFSSLKVGNKSYNVLEFENQFYYNGKYTTGINIIKKTPTQNNGSEEDTTYYVEKDGKRVSGDLLKIDDIIATGDDIWVVGSSGTAEYRYQTDKVYKNGVLFVDNGEISGFSVSADGKNYVYDKKNYGTDKKPELYVNGKIYSESTSEYFWTYGIINDTPLYSLSGSFMKGSEILEKDDLEAFSIRIANDTLYAISDDTIVAYKDGKKYTYTNPHKNTTFYPYHDAQILGDKIFLVERNTLTKKLRSVTIPLSEIVR